MQIKKQELAKSIDKLNWHNIQCDNPADCEAYNSLFDSLLLLEKEEVIKILFSVLEAQNLPDDFLGEDRIMHKFENL